MTNTCLWTAITALSFSALSFAHQPPPGALQACEGLLFGDACKMKIQRGSLDGVCRLPPEQSTLACVPNRRNAEVPPKQPDGSGRNRPPGRQRTANQSSGLDDLIQSTQPPVTQNNYTMTVEGSVRIIQANGIPQHNTGRFPNGGNPNAIREQNYLFRIPAFPTINNNVTPLGMNDFGIAINGVPFDPGAAEWYRGKRNSEWRYEALSGAISLGIDSALAHVQPTGAYHYHGISEPLLQRLDLSETTHSPLVGWAADGFPIYAVYGYRDGLSNSSEVISMKSGYQLKQGQRPMYDSDPGGTYDGTFVADYEFLNSGTLDLCNGRQTVTPDFPGGTYAYFLTEEWPVIPRCFRGQPSQDFMKRRP